MSMVARPRRAGHVHLLLQGSCAASQASPSQLQFPADCTTHRCYAVGGYCGGAAAAGGA